MNNTDIEDVMKSDVSERHGRALGPNQSQTTSASVSHARKNVSFAKDKEKPPACARVVSEAKSQPRAQMSKYVDVRDRSEVKEESAVDIFDEEAIVDKSVNQVLKRFVR